MIVASWHVIFLNRVRHCFWTAFRVSLIRCPLRNSIYDSCNDMSSIYLLNSLSRLTHFFYLSCSSIFLRSSSMVTFCQWIPIIFSPHISYFILSSMLIHPRLFPYFLNRHLTIISTSERFLFSNRALALWVFLNNSPDVKQRTTSAEYFKTQTTQTFQALGFIPIFFMWNFRFSSIVLNAPMITDVSTWYDCM